MVAIDVMTRLLKKGLLIREKNKMYLKNPDDHQVKAAINTILSETSQYCITLEDAVAHIFHDESCIAETEGEFCSTSCDNLAFQLDLHPDWHKQA